MKVYLAFCGFDGFLGRFQTFTRIAVKIMIAPTVIARPIAVPVFMRPLELEVTCPL